MASTFSYIPNCSTCSNLLPTFPSDPDCVGYDQLHSQIGSIIIFPWRSTLPTDWTDPSDWTGLIDNTNSNDTKAKKMNGLGSLLRSGDTTHDFSGRRVVVFDRVYELRFRVLHLHTGHISFAKNLQCGFKDFDVFLETVDDRLIGGEEGLRPFFVDAFFPFEGENTSTEYIEIVMQFKLAKAPDVVDVAGITGSTEGDMNYYQAYTNQTSNSFTFSGSSGVLPSNTDANCFLYQNGRKLPVVHYTLTPAVGYVTIEVDSNIHVAGSNYEFIINT